jgi:tungstate transport system permease protein
VALLIGGNIVGLTDVLTTAISRYTARGELDLAIALGILLMVIVFGINMIIITARKARALFTFSRSAIENETLTGEDAI